jgi:hypothetical protein
MNRKVKILLNKLKGGAEKNINLDTDAYNDLGGKLKVYVPEMEIPFGYDNWKNQSLAHARKTNKNSNDNDILNLLKKLDLPEKPEFGEVKRKRKRKKHRKTRKHRGGKAGEKFREDYKRYLEQLEDNDIDPDEKVKIREKIENLEENEEQTVKNENWKDFMKTIKKSEHSDDYKKWLEEKQWMPSQKAWMSYVAFLYRKQKGSGKKMCGGKKKIPKQFEKWLRFLESNPWDGSGSKKMYLKKMSVLYKK